jgi:DNA-binding response OmpR family regulator
MDTIRVLVIEDDQLTRELNKFMLETIGFVPLIWDVQDFSISKISEFDPSCIIMDYYLGSTLGTDLAKDVRSLYSKYVPIIFTTSSNERSVIEGIFSCGASDYLAKPATTDSLKDKITAQVIKFTLEQVARKQTEDSLTEFVERKNKQAFIRYKNEIDDSK